MTNQEIRELIVESMDDLPKVGAAERYEDSEQFVGAILGERIEAIGPVASAFIKAVGENEPETGCGCSNCCC